MNEDILQVEGLFKAFGGILATADVSFKVFRGEILGIIGPNGAGKTTLFNLISGFIKPERGHIAFKGQNIVGLKPHQISYLGVSRSFQLAHLFPNMTVEQTLFIPQYSKRQGRIRKTRAQVLDQANKLLSLIRFQNKGKDVVKNLTQGELKLLDVARSLASDPELLLLDEPFSGLGYRDIIPLSELMVQLRQDGLTLVVIEHKLRELMKIIDRVVVINFGKVIAEGVPQEIVKKEEVISSYLGKREMDQWL